MAAKTTGGEGGGTTTRRKRAPEFRFGGFREMEGKEQEAAMQGVVRHPGYDVLLMLVEDWWQGAMNEAARTDVDDRTMHLALGQANGLGLVKGMLLDYRERYGGEG